MTLSAGINDLPLPVREQIVKNITPIPRWIRVRPTLHHRVHLYQDIPPELLAPAQSSPVISTAVASVLGPRARYLTRNATKDNLADWVRVLAPYVQAVSFDDSKLPERDYHSHHKSDRVLRESIANIKAVTEPLVALRVLDAYNLPFDLGEHDVTRSVLVAALRHNAATLRELALPVCYVCARALEEVRLPVLEVAQFDFRKSGFWVTRITEKPGMYNMADMLRALQKSRGGDKGVRDLRLGNFLSMPLMRTEEHGLMPEFFSGVRALEVTPDMRGKDLDVAEICALFPQLRCVHVPWGLTESRMRRLVQACPLLEDIHIGRDAPMWIIVEEVHDVGLLPGIFEAVSGKLRSIVLCGTISADSLHALGVTNPNLASMKLVVWQGNVSELLQFTSQCRMLKKLELVYSAHWDDHVGVGSVVLQCMTAAICGASDALRVVTVTMKKYRYSGGENVDELVLALCEILKRLGLHAEMVTFRVSPETREYQVLFEAVRRIIEAATKWCRNMLSFQVDFAMYDMSYWNSMEEMQAECAALVEARDRFWTSAQSLHRLDLANVDKIAEERIFRANPWP